MNKKIDMLLCFGKCDNGQFGMRIDGESDVLFPKITESAFKIKKLACGGQHTLFLTEDGLVYSAGNNDYGQLGRKGVQSRFEQILMLNDKFVVDVACGTHHSLVIDSEGFMYGFGSNLSGQLGFPQEIQTVLTPKRLSHFKNIVCLFSGHSTSFAIDKIGRVSVWGSNSSGLSLIELSASTFLSVHTIQDFDRINIIKISCGITHALALTFNGRVYSWGSNMKFQLGISEYTKAYDKPTLISHLDNVFVIDIACGNDHSVILSRDGRVFTFGCGERGQLGHGSDSLEVYPRQVLDLIGVRISNILCGRDFTLAYCECDKKLFIFGNYFFKNNPKNKKSLFLPQNILIDEFLELEKFHIVSLSCLMEHVILAFRTANDLNEKLPIYPFKINSYGDDLCSVKHSSMLNLQDMNNIMASDFMKKVEQIFESIPCLNASFLRRDHSRWCDRRHNIDFEMLGEFCDRIIYNNYIQQILDVIVSSTDYFSSSDTIDVSRYLFLFMFIIVRFEVEGENKSILFDILSDKVFSNSYNEEFFSVFGFLPPSLFKKVLQSCKNEYIYYYDCILSIPRDKRVDSNQEWVMFFSVYTKYFEILKCFYAVNNRFKLLNYKDFYVKSLGKVYNLVSDYLENFYHLDSYSILNLPFLLDVYQKSLIIYIRRFTNTFSYQDIYHTRDDWDFEEMEREFADHPMSSAYVVRVNRATIYDDIMTVIRSSHVERMNRSLFLSINNEPALDEGGVKKEVFMLVMREIFDVNKSTFIFYEESQLFWFPDTNFEHTFEYMDFGQFVSLALYNNIMLDLNFPIAFYQTILKKEPDFTSLEELDPILAKNMINMIEYDGDDFEDVFTLTFEITRTQFGVEKTFELIENGANIPVTKKNRQKYVDKYVKYIFQTSCKPLFDKFYTGFMMIDLKFLENMVNEYELKEMMCGCPNYDFTELQKYTIYHPEFSSSHPTILIFWSVFHDFSFEQKKKFLQFVTGSDKLPIMGFKYLKFTIQPMLGDDNRLPCSHTCYNVLDLPLYTNYDKCRDKLTIAIENCVGFALI